MSKKEKTRQKCLFCPRQFWATEGQLYCSVPCRKAAAYRRQRGIEVLAARECKKCTVPFTPKSEKHVFCSNKCRRLYHLHGHPGYDIFRDRLFSELEPRFGRMEAMLSKILTAIEPTNEGEKK